MDELGRKAVSYCLPTVGKEWSSYQSCGVWTLLIQTAMSELLVALMRDSNNSGGGLGVDR